MGPRGHASPGCCRTAGPGRPRLRASAALLLGLALALGCTGGAGPRSAQAARVGRELQAKPVSNDVLLEGTLAVLSKSYPNADVTEFYLLQPGGHETELDFTDASGNSESSHTNNGVRGKISGKARGKGHILIDTLTRRPLAPGSKIRIYGKKGSKTSTPDLGAPAPGEPQLAYYSTSSTGSAVVQVSSIEAADTSVPPPSYTFTDLPSIAFLPSFCDLPAAIGVSALENALLNATAKSLRTWFGNCTYGALSMSPDTSMVYPQPIPMPCNGSVDTTNMTQVCSLLSSWKKELSYAAIAAGVDLSRFRHRIMILPQGVNCGWSGMAYVGPYSGDYLTGGYSWTHIHPYYATHLFVQAHELGHNLYMGHAYEGDDVYGDATCVMGRVGSCFNAVHAWQGGWVTPMAQLDGTSMAAGTWYTFRLQDQSGTNVNASVRVSATWPNPARDNFLTYYIAYKRGNMWPDTLSRYWRGVHVYSWYGATQDDSWATQHEAILANYPGATTNVSWAEDPDSPTSLVVRVTSRTGSTADYKATTPSAEVGLCRRSALTEENCLDGLDDDCDGLIDTADAVECAAFIPPSPPSPEPPLPNPPPPSAVPNTLSSPFAAPLSVAATTLAPSAFTQTAVASAIPAPSAATTSAPASQPPTALPAAETLSATAQALATAPPPVEAPLASAASSQPITPQTVPASPPLTTTSPPAQPAPAFPTAPAIPPTTQALSSVASSSQAPLPSASSSQPITPQAFPPTLPTPPAAQPAQTVPTAQALPAAIAAAALAVAAQAAAVAPPAVAATAEAAVASPPAPSAGPPRPASPSVPTPSPTEAQAAAALPSAAVAWSAFAARRPVHHRLSGAAGGQ
ncbi:hypothetical protein HYH03_007434 [Edaphochlamys debaryana]|uniref:Peptidase M11 gametolysin domain-containing protein n=1 Tax=Edaphochlamys debaryana TaxID=47281 RepID=A0A835Y388_9CHLO|nr:hypothetical protein HYH03_007434 [Edaphochlamys debaryana]|eukprot:KAG2494377.1 hypothetical protein HYH03_007434 [Edaphochlamys debaryana]